MELLHLWFGFRKPVSPYAYTLTGFGLMLFKYVTDVALIYGFTGNVWTPLQYLNPMITFREELLEIPWLWNLIVIWALPFIWIGASMTVRRAVNAGLGPWVGLLFFFPLVNYLVMLFLCRIPTKSKSESDLADFDVYNIRFDEAIYAVLTAVCIGIMMMIFSVFWLGHYGVGLFVGTPFAMGFAVAMILNRKERKASASITGVAQLMVMILGGCLLLFALEGLICLLMAYPIVAFLVQLGVWTGEAASTVNKPRGAETLLLLLLLPVLSGVDSLSRAVPLREVVTTIEVDAPPNEVWKNVVEFSELPPPNWFLFKAGVAYPVRARIEGRGVGAIRHCEFSTGPFVEPITTWNEPHRLAFDVIQQPEPMTEMSPYQHVNAPHLLEGFVSRRGAFHLIALDDGTRTRLEGTTWYEIDMFPQIYWTFWSDGIIHAIHQRVLEHIKDQTEIADSRTGTPFRMD